MCTPDLLLAYLSFAACVYMPVLILPMERSESLKMIITAQMKYLTDRFMGRMVAPKRQALHVTRRITEREQVGSRYRHFGRRDFGGGEKPFCKTADRGPSFRRAAHVPYRMGDLADSFAGCFCNNQGFLRSLLDCYYFNNSKARSIFFNNPTTC